MKSVKKAKDLDPILIIILTIRKRQWLVASGEWREKTRLIDRGGRRRCSCVNEQRVGPPRQAGRKPLDCARDRPEAGNAGVRGGAVSIFVRKKAPEIFDFYRLERISALQIKGLGAFLIVLVSIRIWMGFVGDGRQPE
jgi:hypothetical protein